MKIINRTMFAMFCIIGVCVGCLFRQYIMSVLSARNLILVALCSLSIIITGIVAKKSFKKELKQEDHTGIKEIVDILL